MSLPVSEPIFPEEPPPDPQLHRRRKRRRGFVPAIPSERSDFIRDLAHEVTPSIDFFVYSLLCGIVLGFAILFDAPVLYFLAALVSPLMAPVIGLSLASIFGSGRFFLQEAGSFLVGSALVFLCGLLTGWISSLFHPASMLYATLHTNFSWTDVAVLTLAAVLLNILIVVKANSRLMVVSAVLAYEIYLPIGLAGFGLVTHAPGLFPDGLIIFLVNLAWAALVGTAVLALQGLRPKTLFGYTLGTSLLLVTIAVVIAIGGLGTALTARVTVSPAPLFQPSSLPSPTPSARPIQPTLTSIPAQGITPLVPTLTPNTPQGTSTPPPSPTHSLVPTLTPTLTLNPESTPYYARIKASEADGAFIRSEPSYKGLILTGLLNGAMVQLLPEVVQKEGVYWVHVRSADGLIDGWMVRNLITLTTTTTPPAPP